MSVVVGGRTVVGRLALEQQRRPWGEASEDMFEGVTGRGRRLETYEQIAGKPSLKQRDEDKNGDGTIDIKSVYENGKLKQREISDPALVPL